MSTRGALTPIVAAAAGLATAVTQDWALNRYLPQRRVRTHAIGLAVAGAVYPALRSAERGGARGIRELAGLGAFGAAAAVGAAKSDSPGTAPLVAAAWAAHALFDLLHDTGQHSRVPTWYPAMCAGYDLGLAALLLAR